MYRSVASRYKLMLRNKFRYILILLLSFALFGCSKKQSVKDFSAIDGTIKTKIESTENVKKEDSVYDNNEMQTETVNEEPMYYTKDSHFYDGGSLEYLDKINDAKLRFTITDAFVSSDKSLGGKYFVDSKYLENSINYIREEAKENITILFLKVDLTNLSKKDFTIAFNDFSFFARVNDSYGESQGYGNKKIISAGSLMFDFDKSVNNETLFYANNMKAGQTISTTIAVPILEKYSNEELYVKLGIEPIGVRDEKPGSSDIVPNDSKELKFLKINIRK